MTLKLEISGDKLTGLSAALKKNLERVVAVTAAQVEGQAKQNSPVDTGNLRASISHEAEGLQGSVSVAADYGIHVEYGTEHQSPQPFLGPAVTEAKDDFERRIEQALQDATR